MPGEPHAHLSPHLSVVMCSNLLCSHSDDAIRLLEEEQQLAAASAARLALKNQVCQVQQEMTRLKKNYDSLLEESRLTEENVRDQIFKQQAVTRIHNSEQRSVYQSTLHTSAHPGTSQSKVHTVR